MSVCKDYYVTSLAVASASVFPDLCWPSHSRYFMPHHGQALISPFENFLGNEMPARPGNRGQACSTIKTERLISLLPGLLSRVAFPCYFKGTIFQRVEEHCTVLQNRMQGQAY